MRSTWAVCCIVYPLVQLCVQLFGWYGLLLWHCIQLLAAGGDQNLLNGFWNDAMSLRDTTHLTQSQSS